MISTNVLTNNYYTKPYLNHVSATPGCSIGLHSYGIWYYPLDNTTWSWSAYWEVSDTDIVIFSLMPGLQIERKNTSKLIFSLYHKSLDKNPEDFTGFMSQKISIDDLDNAVKIYVEHLITFIQDNISTTEIKVYKSASLTCFEFCIDELRSREKCDEFLFLCELHTLLQQYTYSSISWVVCGGIVPFGDYVNRVYLKSQSVYYSMSLMEDRTTLQTQVYWPKTLLNREFDRRNIRLQFNETLCHYMPRSWPFEDYIDYSGEEAVFRTLANVEDSELFQYFENGTYTGFRSRCKLLDNPYVFNYLLIILSHELKYTSIKELNDFNTQHLM